MLVARSKDMQEAKLGFQENLPVLNYNNNNNNLRLSNCRQTVQSTQHKHTTQGGTHYSRHAWQHYVQNG